MAIEFGRDYGENVIRSFLSLFPGGQAGFGVRGMITFGRITTLAAAAVLAAGMWAASPAAAATTCQFGTEADFTATADVWTSTACVGEVEGNDDIGNDSGANVDLNNPANFGNAALFGSTDWSLDTRINVSEVQDGFFFDAPSPDGILNAMLDADALSGTWSVDSWAGIGQAMLVLKGGNGFAAYLLDLTAGLTGGWNTQALTVGRNDNQPALSHVSLYTTPAPIPLPAAGFLLLGALGGLGVMARRRRRTA